MSKVLKLGLLARQLNELLRSCTPAVLYVIDSWTLPVVLAASVGRPRRRRVFVYHTFDWLDPALNTPIPLCYERYVCRQADLCVNCDSSRARLAQSVYRLNRLPLWVPNYPSLGSSTAPRDEQLRARLLGNDGRWLVICPSVAAPDRFHRELLEAFTALPRSYRLLTFGVAGTPYVAKCHEFAARAGLTGRVHFLEPVPYEELERYLACADIGLVLNDWKRSSGYWLANPDRLARCLSYGLPVVASAVPNLEAVVYKWGLGECCDPYEPQHIATAIQAVAEGSLPIETRRTNVLRAFRQELHFERRGKLLAQTLHRLCAAKITPERGATT